MKCQIQGTNDRCQFFLTKIENRECVWHSRLNLTGMVGCWGIMRKKGMEGRMGYTELLNVRLN